VPGRVYPIWHPGVLGAYSSFSFHCYSRPYHRPHHARSIVVAVGATGKISRTGPADPSGPPTTVRSDRSGMAISWHLEKSGGHWPPTRGGPGEVSAGGGRDSTVQPANSCSGEDIRRNDQCCNSLWKPDREQLSTREIWGTFCPPLEKSGGHH
jgi:hypothetical protein